MIEIDCSRWAAQFGGHGGHNSGRFSRVALFVFLARLGIWPFGIGAPPPDSRSRKDGGTMKGKFGLLMMALALWLLVGPLVAQEKQPKNDKDKASLWMAKKLEYSQKILTGLTRADFDMVKTNADAMLVVGFLESWDRADLPSYKKQLKGFEKANKDLVRQAEAKDIDAATSAYSRLIVSCVECHKVVRDAKKKK